ncbi:MAG: family 43 glycosylhydrolase, partial [Sphingomonadales bacterium]|nr:family 43 glycosylhydrolase [Sphingomonadales bacterium]
AGQKQVRSGIPCSGDIGPHVSFRRRVATTTESHLTDIAHLLFRSASQVGVHLYRSRNLVDWKDEGIVLKVSDDPSSDITRGSIIERPKVIYNRKTGKFVMWFHLELKGQGYRAARSGVAVANKVEGPYQFLGSFRPNAGKWPANLEAGAPDAARQYLERDIPGGQMSRDMTLFVDDDGAAYQFYASEENHTLQISKLTDDYLRPSGLYVRAMPMGDNEAPSVFKHDGKYYLITSGLSGWAPNAARSFVADQIFGPWMPLGNPVRGNPEQVAKTFGGQATFVLPYRKGFIFMGDIWKPKNPIDGRYLWLPIEWEGNKPVLRWHEHWGLGQLKE